MYNRHRIFQVKTIDNSSKKKMIENNIYSTSVIMGSLNDKIGESWKINQMIGQKPSFSKIK
tara:strand:- start:74 stop:256 length:183 start_codon:yes stop_codon:yes gene_type:complete